MGLYILLGCRLGWAGWAALVIWVGWRFIFVGDLPGLVIWLSLEIWSGWAFGWAEHMFG